MSDSFTKLFRSMLSSTLWTQEDAETRLVWITMLAMADADGYVGASIPGLAHAARVPLESAEVAITSFLAPDPHSRTKDHDGRRIVEADRGWSILNYKRFRDERNADLRRVREAERKRRSRRQESAQ